MAGPRRLRDFVAEAARFGLVGVLSNVVYFGALWLLRTLLVPWWLAASVAYALSMLLNYALQRTFTFRSTRSHGQAARRYVVVQLTGLAINSAILEILLGRHVLDHMLGPEWSAFAITLPGLPALPLRVALAQGFSLAVTMACSYVAQRYWVFRPVDGTPPSR